MRASVPSQFTSGESLAWEKSYSDYPADDGWTLTYYFRGAGKGFDVTATADGKKFEITVEASDTAEMTAGSYSYQAFVTDGTENIEVDEGKISVLPSLSGISVNDTHDGRSEFQIILDAIDATLKGKATKDQLSYSIGDRELRRYDITDLLKLRDKYQQLVNQEILSEKRKKGLGLSTKYYTRFNRPR